MTRPDHLTASEALRAIRRGELSPSAWIAALLDRIREAEPSIAAWVRIDELGARDEAARNDLELARRSHLPLFGVPIGVKDIFSTRGLPTSAGFEPWEGRETAEDATIVARARAAGAIILGKTVTTQFAFADPPKTRNPWNLDRTPGGSSSGSAAAVAARMVPLALGSQTAGSILRPAAYCGVLGLKPTFGLVSRHGAIPLAWSLDHPGPIARSVEDLALALSVLAGPDRRDPATHRARVGDYLGALRAPVQSPICAVIEDFFEAAEAPVRGQVQDAISKLEERGARLRRIRLATSLPIIAAAQQTIMQVEAAEVHARLHARHAEAYGPRMRSLIEVGHLVPASLYLRAQRIRRQFRLDMEAARRDVDCLLMPTVSNLAPDRAITGDRTFQAPWSLIGWPALTIPSGLADGLPTGLQIVTGPWQEERLLSIARWAETILPPLPAPAVRAQG